VSRSLRGERGGVLALSAIIIPVFLLLTALSVDVGNWYTHKRQLQTRADAAAFAAGIEYAKSWKACVYAGTDPTRLADKATAALEIANAARQYAADPEASDYSPASPPSLLYNADIANQANLDVIINSPDFTNNNDNLDETTTDPGGSNPCFKHAGDDTSAAGGQWTDVKVKEKNLPSVFGGIGLGLFRNTARARVEIRPALSGRKFLPLAIPNNVVSKVQIRYYDECRDPNHTSPLAVKDLAPLPVADQGAWAGTGGGTLWALPAVDGDLSVGDKARSFHLPVPDYDPSCGDYLPIGVQVRLTSRDEININGDCGTLAASKFADCFNRLSQIRVWNDGNADSQPRLTNVTLTGGCPSEDAYFGTPLGGLSTCSYGVSAEVNWGTRDDGQLNVPANFQVSANGVQLNPPGGSPSGVWTTNGTPIVANPGPNPVTITLGWRDNDPTHSWAGDQCTNGNNTPCKYNGTQAAHRAFVGTNATAGAVELVRSSRTSFVSNLPGPPFDNAAGNGPLTGCANRQCEVFPTVGIRSVLKTGILTTLRLDDPQANQTLRCDPNAAQGQEFQTFQNGCGPWYGANTFTNGPWWNSTTKTCPPTSSFFSYNTMPAPYGKNSSTNYWQCVPTAPGLSTPVIGEGLSVATGNCSNINNNSCQQTTCLVDGNYDGKPNQTSVPWITKGDSNNGRVVRLFIIPYQALKNSSGGDPEETVPILGFASFYVMNWTGSNAQNSDPCPDPTFNGVAIPAPPPASATGVFIETVDYETGPVDQNATCVEGQLTPCRALLVR
jgi:hypothetical protein